MNYLLFFSLVFFSGFSFAAEELIDSRESLYNNIYIYDIDGLRHMRFSLNQRYYTESVYNPNNELEIPLKYPRYMTLGLLYPEKIKRVLLIGLGGGRTSWYIHKHLPDADITIAELDPDVIKLAIAYFGIAENNKYKIINKDGRSFLMKDKNKYDVIFIDAYQGPFVPFHLLTKEFFQLVNNHLTDSGVVIQNINPYTMLFPSTAATLNAVFQSVDYYQASENIIGIAYNSERLAMSNLSEKAKKLQEKYQFNHSMVDILGNRHFYTPEKSATILTDDYAPVNSLKGIKKQHINWDD